MTLKKFVAYDPDTHEFKGFFSEDRPDLPEHHIEVNPETCVGDKGNHTHFNPETERWYTPTDVAAAKHEAQERFWRDVLLQRTDKGLLEDYPITASQKAELKIFRQGLRDYPQTGEKPPVPEWLDEVIPG